MTDNREADGTGVPILNDDVIGVIKSFLPKETLVWLSKEDYVANHSVIKRLIPQCVYNEYIHDVILCDHSFVFTQIIDEHFDKFHHWRHFEVAGNRHHSYLTYLRDYCLFADANKCKAVIDRKAAEKGFSENWYKRRRIIISTTDRTGKY